MLPVQFLRTVHELDIYINTLGFDALHSFINSYTFVVRHLMSRIKLFFGVHALLDKVKRNLHLR